MFNVCMCYAFSFLAFWAGCELVSAISPWDDDFSMIYSPNYLDWFFDPLWALVGYILMIAGLFFQVCTIFWTLMVSEEIRRTKEKSKLSKVTTQVVHLLSP